MKVSDADEGRNAKVRLRVTAGNEDGRFRIDPESGVLFVARSAKGASRYDVCIGGGRGSWKSGCSKGGCKGFLIEKNYSCYILKTNIYLIYPNLPLLPLFIVLPKIIPNFTHSFTLINP